MKSITISDTLYNRLDTLRKLVDKTRPIDGVISALIGWYEKVTAEIDANPGGRPAWINRGWGSSVGPTIRLGATGPTGMTGFVPPEDTALADVAQQSLYMSLFADAWAQYPGERKKELECGDREITEADKPTPGVAYILADTLLDIEWTTDVCRECAQPAVGKCHKATCVWGQRCDLARELLRHRG